MADPQRLLDDPEGSQLGRTLLASAVDDAPTADGRAASARRLGLAGAALAAGSGKALAAGALWWKLAGLALLIGGVTVIAVTRGSTQAPPPPPPPAPPPRVAVAPPAAPAPAPPPPAIAEQRPSPVVAVEPPPKPTAPKRVHHEPPAPAPVAAAPVEPAPPPEAPVAGSPPPEPPAPEQIDPRRLAAEVAILDRARAALRAGDTTAALAALDEHQRTFADGSLLAAADVVRIETLIQRRDLAAARARAEAFIAAHPRSPLARRVHSLLDRIAAQESP